jgi:hypothetical protein
MKTAVWISYDLGIRGNYAGLYAWLDEHDAKECGESVAFINYAHNGNLREKITTEIKQALQNETGARIYLIYRDHKSNKNKGAFIIGGRRASPWTGYSSKNVDNIDEGD